MYSTGVMSFIALCVMSQLGRKQPEGRTTSDFPLWLQCLFLCPRMMDGNAKPLWVRQREQRAVLARRPWKRPLWTHCKNFKANAGGLADFSVSFYPHSAYKEKGQKDGMIISYQNSRVPPHYLFIHLSGTDRIFFFFKAAHTKSKVHTKQKK